MGYPAFTALALTGVPTAKQGIAAGIQSTLYTAGSGLGLSLTSLCLDALHARTGANAGTTGFALMASCAVIAAIALAGLVILAKKAYICTPI